MPKGLFGKALQFNALILYGAVLLLVVHVASLSAQVPVPGTALVPQGVNGYTVSFAGDWVDSDQGFRPVRVTVQTAPAKATVEDERFEIQMRSRGSNEHVTSTELVISSGQKSGTVEIYVHDLFTANSYDNWISVSKKGGGQLCETPWSGQHNWVQHPRFLVISDEFPARDISQFVCFKGKSKQILSNGKAKFISKSTLPSFEDLSTVYNTNSVGIGGNSKALSFRALEAGDGFHYSRFTDLPQSWIGYQGVDVIMVPLDQFKSLTRKNELQRSNLEKWVATGGALVVYDTGPKFKKADQIWPLLLGADREFVAEQKNSLWRVPNSKLAKLPDPIDPADAFSRQDYRNNSSIWMSPRDYDIKGIAVSKWRQYPSPRQFPKSTRLGTCDYLDGCIVAVDSDMSKWKPKDWTFLHNAIAINGIPIHQRVAASAIGEKMQSINFQIPGVGEPPVQSFQVLIGLFLLIAGPVMVVVLKRTRQMQYLFVAVPLLSAAVCSSLFLYAIIVDGSSRWGRCDSVTHLDHRTSAAVTHTRATYYCGRHPGEYELPVDAYGIAYSELSNPSRVEFEKGSMKLSGGDVSARIPHEVTSVRAHQTNDRLLVLPGKSGEQADQSKPPPTGSDQDDSKISSAQSAVVPRVQNRLGADVRWALIRTDDGYFVVENLQMGQTVDSTVSTIGKQVQNVRSITLQLSPNRVGSVYKNKRYSSNLARQASLFPGGHRNWGEDVRIVGLLKRGKLDELLSRPNSYVAIMEEFPLAAEQLEPVQYKMQLHVVRGQW